MYYILVAVCTAVAVKLGSMLWSSFRPSPYLFAALRCLKTGQRSGRRRFYTRLELSWVFVDQFADENGVVVRTRVCVPNYDEQMMSMLASAQSWRPGWPRTGNHFDVDLQPFFKAYPKLRDAGLRVWAELHPEYGTIFYAERDPTAILRPV